jgi:hypothetical protein
MPGSASERAQRSELLLLQASAFVVAAPGAEPWDYGWFLPEYRASASAALVGASGPVTIGPEGRPAFEEAVDLLARESRVRERWDSQELWGIVAALVVRAAESGEAAATITTGVRELRSADAMLILMALANVVPPETPLIVADCVFGRGDDAFRRVVNAVSNGRCTAMPETLERVVGAYATTRDELAVCGTWSAGQSAFGVERAESHIRGILDVALLLEPAPETLGLHSLRGPTNRPGIRGIALHRPAVEAALGANSASSELVAKIAVVTRAGVADHVHWHSADPVPLETLIPDDARRVRIERCVLDDSSISRRIRLAARWYAEAHWESASVDALLALGIAIDALIGTRSGLPGRAMRERFALLEPALARGVQ